MMSITETVSSMTPITQICLDLDEVLCDFVGPALALHGWTVGDALARWPEGEYRIENVLGIDTAAFWAPIDELGAAFWAHLPVVFWADTLLANCRRHAPVTIVTRGTSPAAAAGKVAWLKRHNFPRYLIGPSKDTCAHAGSVLIDDCDENCEAFVAAGGRAIVFPRHWNSRSHFKQDPTRYVRDQLNWMNQPAPVERRSACHV